MTLLSPSLIVCPNTKRRFVLFECPDESNLSQHARILKKYDVRVLIRCCNAPYDLSKFSALIGCDEHHHLTWRDGDAPPRELLNHWIRIVKQVPEDKTFGLHCVSGLGRSATLVALALMRNGLSGAGAIAHIRKSRPKCFSVEQERYLLAEHKSWSWPNLLALVCRWNANPNALISTPDKP